MVRITMQLVSELLLKAMDMPRHAVCAGKVSEGYLRKEGIKVLMHLPGSATASVAFRCIRALLDYQSMLALMRCSILINQ